MTTLKNAVHCHNESDDLNNRAAIFTAEGEACEEACTEEKVTEPNHTWVDHLLDCVTVQNQSAGRIRFHLDFKGDEILQDCLRREVGKLEHAKLRSYSIRTRTALVTYESAKVDEVQVTVAMLAGVREFARIHGECDLDHHHHERRRKAAEFHGIHEHDDADHHHDGEEDCDHDHSSQISDAGIRKEFLKLGITGVALGYFLYKRLKTPINLTAAASSPLSLAAFVTIASGYPIFRDGYKAVANKKKPTDDTLIGIAVGSSVILGESLTGLSVVWLIQLGRILELVTLKRSRTAVKELMDITPTEAWHVVGGRVAKVSVEALKKGDTIRVFHGEKVPLDGTILSGTGSVKESFLTGEAIPKEKTIGEQVYAGSVVEAGEIDVEVTSLAHDTVVATMIDAIENLRDQKAPIEKVGTRFASKFVPISLTLAAVTFLVTRDVRRAITMLVIACPCAAGLATPTAVSSTIGQVARKGLLVKGGTHLETGARVNAIVFDKTGTLTMGMPSLLDVIETEAGKKLGREECLRLAAIAEQHTTHPLGRVLVNEARAQKIEMAPVDSYKLHEGMGIEAKVEGKVIFIGSKRFLKSQDVGITKALEAQVAEFGKGGASVVYLAIDGKLMNGFVIQDQIRPEAVETLDRLRELGISRFIMATGDQRATAQYVADKVGIQEVHAEMLPSGKLELIKRLKSEGYKVAMMGDGVNDAQALAEADLSIAMGTSRCDVAIETADVTISRDDFRLVAEMFDASQKTLRTIYQNFIAAVAINAGGIVYGAMGQLSPFSAAIVHNASTIAVVINSLRLGKSISGKNPLGVLKEVNS